MNRPEYKEHMKGVKPTNYDVKLSLYNDELEDYIDYLELRVTRLTEGLNDIVITLQNMQRDGKEG